MRIRITDIDPRDSYHDLKDQIIGLTGTIGSEKDHFLFGEWHSFLFVLDEPKVIQMILDAPLCEDLLFYHVKFEEI